MLSTDDVYKDCADEDDDAEDDRGNDHNDATDADQAARHLLQFLGLSTDLLSEHTRAKLLGICSTPRSVYRPSFRSSVISRQAFVSHLLGLFTDLHIPYLYLAFLMNRTSR